MKLAYCVIALTIVLALALAATAGAAPTTMLCSADTGESPAAACPPDEEVTHIHETSIGKAKLLSPVNVECDVLFLGEVGESSSPQVVEGKFTYTNCGSCTVTEEGGPSIVEVFREGHEAATTTVESEVHVNCTGFNCYYNGEGLEGAAKGPLLSSQKNGEVSIQEQEVNKVKGFLCPSKAFLDITTTPLSTAYIANSTVLCSKAATEVEEELVCPEKALLTEAEVDGEGESEGESETEFSLESESGDITCPEAEFESELTSEKGEVQGQMTDLAISGTCGVTIPSYTTASINAVTPFNIELFARNDVGQEALMKILLPKLEVKLTYSLGTLTCEYGKNNGEFILGVMRNATDIITVTSKQVKRSGGSVSCPTFFYVTAKFKVFRPVNGGADIVVVANR